MIPQRGNIFICFIILFSSRFSLTKCTNIWFYLPLSLLLINMNSLFLAHVYLFWILLTLASREKKLIKQNKKSMAIMKKPTKVRISSLIFITAVTLWAQKTPHWLKRTWSPFGLRTVQEAESSKLKVRLEPEPGS